VTADEFRDLLIGMMETLVPDEEYSVIVEEVNGQFKMELFTDSKRAQVAWAEISFHLEDCLDGAFQTHAETLGLD